MVFLIKPGYEGAYQQLSPRLYPLEQQIVISPQAGWQETRIVHTILGYHLLVKTEQGWSQHDLTDFQPREKLASSELIKLVEDSLPAGSERYGSIIREENNGFITTTVIELSFDWNSLTIRQQGDDTKLIGLLYKIHYLQWLGHREANLLLGVFGLLSLAILVYFGMAIYIRGRSLPSRGR